MKFSRVPACSASPRAVEQRPQFSLGGGQLLILGLQKLPQLGGLVAQADDSATVGENFLLELLAMPTGMTVASPELRTEETLTLPRTGPRSDGL
jgi:hypothetical protein